MAWRLADSVVRGEIDNRTRGRVTGRLWLAGRDEPLVIDLAGDCMRDLAGCLVTFSNPSPAPANIDGLDPVQEGRVGEITASRKIFVLDVSVEEAMRLGREDADIPKHQANGLYVEWFSERNGRVVIESTSFLVQVSMPEWTMSEEEQHTQLQDVHETFRGWLDHFDRILAESEEDLGEDEEELPMDEFEWEKRLRESDAKSEKLGEVFEKYNGHPDCEKLVAREMGWTWIEEELEAQERGILSANPDPASPLANNWPEPNPEREGIDWVRAYDGDIQHPLALRASRLGLRVWHYCEEHGLMAENGDKDAQHFVLQLQMTGAKLAGALNHLAYDDEPDNGFIVAGLKRALHYVHKSLDAEVRVHRRGLIDPASLEGYHRELFHIRQHVVDLMKEHRSKICDP
jgi:hypothetical protein